MTLTLSPLTERDCPILASVLAPLDRGECLASSGQDPLISLAQAARGPWPAFTLKDELGFPVFAFGAQPGRGKLHLWLLSAEDVKRSEIRWLIRHLDTGLRMLHGMCFAAGVTVPTVCHVWAQNTPHIKWLSHVGFVPTGGVDYRVNAEPFLELQKHHV